MKRNYLMIIPEKIRTNKDVTKMLVLLMMMITKEKEKEEEEKEG